MWILAIDKNNIPTDVPVYSFISYNRMHLLIDMDIFGCTCGWKYTLPRIWGTKYSYFRAQRIGKHNYLRGNWAERSVHTGYAPILEPCKCPFPAARLKGWRCRGMRFGIMKFKCFSKTSGLIMLPKIVQTYL